MARVMVLESEAFGRRLGHEGGALMNGISVLTKDTTQKSLVSFHHVTAPGRGLSPEHDHAGALILDFPAFRIVRNKFLLLVYYPAYSVF